MEYLDERDALEREDKVDTGIPHSIEDERYTIGVCLFNDKSGYELASRLDEACYHIPQNARAYKSIVALTDRGEGVTLHSLAAEIKRQLPEDEQDNPFEYYTPTELAQSYSREEYRDTRSFNASIARLKELKSYRLLISSSREVLAKAYKKAPLSELLSTYEETGLAISRTTADNVINPELACRQLDTFYDDLQEGRIDTLPTAFPELNRILWGGGFWGGDNIIVAGETSTGKTTLALNLATDAAILGKRVLYFSREMAYLKLLIRVHSRLARVPAWKIRPGMGNYEEGIRERLRRTMDYVNALPLFWDDRTSDIRAIRRKAKEYVRNEGVELVVLDYLKLIQPPPGFRGSTADRVSTISREIKEGATELGIPFIDIAQLRRQTHGEKEGGNEPSLDQLKDSGDIENDADTVIMLWRNKAEQEEGVRNQLLDAYAKVAKQRQGELGRFKLKFAPDIYAFTSIEQLEGENFSKAVRF